MVCYHKKDDITQVTTIPILKSIVRTTHAKLICGGYGSDERISGISSRARLTLVVSNCRILVQMGKVLGEIYLACFTLKKITSYFIYILLFFLREGGSQKARCQTPNKEAQDGGKDPPKRETPASSENKARPKQSF